MEGKKKSTNEISDECQTLFSSIGVELKTVIRARRNPSRIPFSNLEWMMGEYLINTVNGIAVMQIAGRSGDHPDTSPSEVPQPWKVKIPQRKN